MKILLALAAFALAAAFVVSATMGAEGIRELLKSLAQKRGFYIPSFYDVQYRADGTIDRFVPNSGSGAPAASFFQ